MKELKRFNFKLYGFVVILDFIVILALYFIMPIVQNYPPFSEDLNFQKQVEGLTHIQQYIVIFIAVSALHILGLKVLLRKMRKTFKKYSLNDTMDKDEIIRVRKDCINIPYKYYIVQMLIILVIGITVTLAFISDWLTIFRFFIMLFAVTSLIELIQFIYLQSIFRKIILLTYDIDDKFEKDLGYRINFSDNLVLQIIPFLAVSIIVVSLIGYAKTTQEKGNVSADYYKAYLDLGTVNSVNMEGIKQSLDRIPLKDKEDFYFIIPPNREDIYVSIENRDLTEFFLTYMDTFFEETNGRVYEFFGTEQQAYAKKLVDSNNEEWYIGFEYWTKDNNLMLYYISIMMAVLSIYTILIYLWSNNATKNVIKISESLDDILKQTEITKNKIIPIMSNDELGDLAYSYNKIQEKLLSQQGVIEKQAQFATLGEVAGGIAHDLNSPLLSLKADLYNIKKYLQSDKIQAEEETKNRLLQIINNTEKNVENMSKTVNSMRDQIRNTGDKEKQNINVVKLIERTKILMGSYLRNNNCVLNIKSEGDIEIFGEDNKLDRVITNIIKNSIDAYKQNNSGGNIDVLVKKEDNNCMIYIKDEAGGIKKEIADTLFKEMKTTKEEEGTGFGLYYTYRIIGGDFKGDITFETEERKGTTFIIKIPLKGEE